MLEALREADARATFFVVAPEALRHPALISEMLLAGHRVEFHCSAHLRHTERTRLDVEADTREGLRDLASLGVSPRLWRPPWGVIAPRTEALADAFGLRLVLWTIDPHDWRGDTAPAMLDHAEGRIAPGSVVLLHDGLGPGALRPGCEETVGLIHWQFSGASTSLTAETYREVGGLEPVTALEDEALEGVLRRRGIPIDCLLSVRVTTSARLVGRAERGLAHDLAEVAAKLGTTG